MKKGSRNYGLIKFMYFTGTDILMAKENVVVQIEECDDSQELA